MNGCKFNSKMSGGKGYSWRVIVCVCLPQWTCPQGSSLHSQVGITAPGCRAAEEGSKVKGFGTYPLTQLCLPPQEEARRVAAIKTEVTEGESHYT